MSDFATLFSGIPRDPSRIMPFLTMFAAVWAHPRYSEFKVKAPRVVKPVFEVDKNGDPVG